MSAELKPCPFCGGAAEWNTGKNGDGSPWRYIACEECEAMGPWQKNDPLEPGLNEAEAIAAWNTRALLPAQTEPDAGRVEEAAPQADLVTESEVYAALRGWQKAIIDAPEEGVEERRRRCMRAALKAARACSSAQSRQNTPPSPPREEIEHQGVVAVGVKG